MSTFEQPVIREIHPSDLLDMISNGEASPSQIIDVREHSEWEYYHLEGTLHIPMNSIPERLDELDAHRDFYIMCAHGVRSVYVLQYLQQHGFSRLWNVTGGISVAAEKLGFRYD